MWGSEANKGGEGHSVKVCNKHEGPRNTLHIICAPFSLSVGRLLIEACTRLFSLAFPIPKSSAYCVYMFVCVCLEVRVPLPLTYVPSFVSEDYSFPFEVRQLARRGRSERQLRAGFHTSPTAVCRLGGK